MDVFIWGTLGLVALVCVAIVLYGLSRLAGSTEPMDATPLLEMDYVDAEINRALDPYMTYINAIRSGKRDKLANAPLPEFYTEELLLEALRRTQRQPSLYDAFWEYSSHRFLTRLFAKTARVQAEYSGRLVQSAAAHNAFLRELAKRPDLQLEYEKIRSSLQADIAEKNLRTAKADSEQKHMTAPAPAPQPTPQPDRKARSFEEKMTQLNAWRDSRVAFFDKGNYSANHSLRKQVENTYQDLSRRINDGENVKIPD